MNDDQTIETPPALPDATPEEDYNLTFDEGVQVDAELLGSFRQTAREAGLSAPQAQKVADLYAGHMAGLGQKFQEARIQALNDYINTQNAALSARPGFQEDLALAKKTLKEFGSEELSQVLQETALGSHPALFDFMVAVGRALGEPGFKGHPGQSPELPLHERLWGQG